MTVALNVEEIRARNEAKHKEYRRELVLKANPELRARELADKYGLDMDDVLMHLRERFLAVVEDAEAAIQTERLTRLDDTARIELREWLQINKDARAIAAKSGLDSVRVLTILVKTAKVGNFSCGRGEIKYNPCLETALTRAQELTLFSPLEVVQYFEDYVVCIVSPDETECGLLDNVSAVLSVISLLTGRLDKGFAPLLSKLAAKTAEAEAKPAEQAA
jgi:hypothetical protein